MKQENAQAGERTQLLKIATTDEEAVKLHHKLYLIRAIEDLFKMMDEGILVRDTSQDGGDGFYKRSIDFVARLAKIKESVDTAKASMNRKSAALDLIETINAAGGISRALEPVGAPEWIDLALAYVKACEECGVEPKYNSNLNECDKCHTPVEEIIGCPDGAELCQSCFDSTHGIRGLS